MPVKPLRLAGVFALSWLTGCGEPAAPGTLNDLTVDAEVTNTTVPAGETLVVVIRIENPTNRTVSFEAPCPPLTIRITTATGDVYPTADTGGCSVIGDPARMIVEPDEVVSWAVAWRAVTNYHSSTGQAQVPLPPGDYSVVGGVPYEYTRELAVESEPVSFTVIDP